MFRLNSTKIDQRYFVNRNDAPEDKKLTEAIENEGLEVAGSE